MNRKPTPLIYLPVAAVYLALVAATFLYLQDWVHHCLPAFVVLGGVTALAWYLMLFGDSQRGPDLVPAAAVLVGWLAYGLVFGAKPDVVPEFVTVLVGAVAILLVALSYTPLLYRKKYVSKMVAQIHLLLILFAPSHAINVASAMDPQLVFAKVTAFYVVYVLSDFETRLASDPGDYYASRDRRITQTLWILMTWGFAFTLFFAALQALALGWLMLAGAQREPLLPVSQEDAESESESEEEEVEAPIPRRPPRGRGRGRPPRGRRGYRGRGRRGIPRGRARANGTVRGVRGGRRRGPRPRGSRQRPPSRSSESG